MTSSIKSYNTFKKRVLARSLTSSGNLCAAAAPRTADMLSSLVYTVCNIGEVTPDIVCSQE